MPEETRDPTRAAQENMRTPLPKRFYEAAEVEADAGTGLFAVKLDGKSVRTPARSLLALPTEKAARLIAGEFEAQRDVIDPLTMPVLKTANTAIDGVSSAQDAVAEDILRFAGTDLLCYRAEGPQALIDRQSDAWDPILDWARARMGARFILAEGVMHVQQPRETIGAVNIHLKLRASDPFRLAALHVLTALTGSALIALAIEDGAISAEEGWAAAHVDEDWNIEQWGEDAEAAAHRAARERDHMGAAALLDALA